MIELELLEAAKAGARLTFYRDFLEAVASHLIYDDRFLFAVIVFSSLFIFNFYDEFYVCLLLRYGANILDY